ncbi:hypothetical protein GC173_08890 [bacterium]|nr:hypothetical protein [bacterium]
MKPFPRLLAFLFLLACPLMASVAFAQVSWILESAEGTVRHSDGKTEAKAVTTPPQMALNRGDMLQLELGAKVVVFDGRKRTTQERSSEETTPLTLRVPAPVTRGNVLERIMAGAAERRRQSAQGGVLVRVGTDKPDADIVWPPRDGAFDGSRLPAVKVKLQHLSGRAVRLELLRAESIGAVDGVLVDSVDLNPDEAEFLWEPRKKAFSKGVYFLVRLRVDGESWDGCTVWKYSSARKELEKELAAELELKSTKELKKSEVYPYFVEEMEASRLQDPPKR